MNQSCDISIKCPNSEHTKDVKFVCFDESCKAQRLYCFECIKNGIHVSHPQYQEELPFLFEYIERVEKECDNLINSMNKQMDLIQQDFYILIGGIRSKYQVAKQQLIGLNSEQINQFLTSTIHFKSFECTIQNQLQQFTNEFQNQILKLLFDLHLNECNYYQVSKIHIQLSEELYQKGYILYSKEKKHDEAIQIFDQALNLNSKHQLSLWCKAESLRILGQYNEAIIWVDKALQVDQKHRNSLYTKADSLKMLGQYNEAIIWADKALQVDQKLYKSFHTKAGSLKMLGQYNEAIIWADKALQVNPKHCSSLCTKGDSLRKLTNYKEALEVIEHSLQINPNHFDSLKAKGQCLQDQNQFEEAIIFYDKALTITSSHQQINKKKNECLKALETK